MGLTKQYLRYEPGPIFGVIASSTANILFVNFRGRTGNFVAVPACENVLIWNYRTNESVFVLKGEKHSVTCMVSNVNCDSLAVGYADGVIRVFNLKTGELMVSFSGHKTQVSCLAYDKSGLRLASGGKDTDIVLWDLVGENGLFRLKGHKGPVTSCHFLERENVLITSSEDSLLKFWNLHSQHCFKTLVGNRGEIWDFIVLNDERLITGINDSDLRVWDMKFKQSQTTEMSPEDWISEDDDLTLVEVGKILTTGEKKTTSIHVDNNSRLFSCHGYSKTLLLFKVLDEEESLKKMRRRKKKELKHSENKNEIDADDFKITLSDQITRLNPIQVKSKVVNSHIVTKMNGEAKVALLLSDNSFCVYTINVETNEDPVLLSCASFSGHRSPARTLCYSSDNMMLLSASNEVIKIWNTESNKCMHSFESELSLCSLFATGNNYVIVGSKTGHLRIFELSSHQLVECLEAHEGPISSIAASPDQRSLVTGSGDKDLKFWDYELIRDENYSDTKKRLSLIHTKTLKMSEEIQCLRYSPNQKFIAVSLLDCTVKVFFSDTLKFAFSLYGHKLPIPCIDISYDSTLLVTGSKDKNIKIWSLEFGNCIKSIFAHEESITCIQFLPKTHYIFTAGNDKKVKQWDCDNFQKIITLEGHQSGITAMAISPDGVTVTTTSQDRSIRYWEKTNEPLILEEEQEIEKEKELDKELVSNKPVIAGERNKEVDIATKVTIEALKSAEQLMEAMDIYKIEVLNTEEYQRQCKVAGKSLPPPTAHPMLTAFQVTCPLKYMMKVLQKTRSSNLEEILLHLPFNYATELLKILSEFVERNWEVELSTRCILFLIKIHLSQLTLNQSMFSLVENLKLLLLEKLSNLKDTVGFNLAGLNFMQRQIEGQEELSLFQDASRKLKRKSRKRNLISFV